MNKRQKEVQQVFLDNEKAVLKKLEVNYQEALAEINSKIESLLARQDADMQHVIYQIEYQKALKDQVSAILEQLHNNEFETLSEFLTQTYEEGFMGTMYDLQGQGIPLIIPIPQEQVAAAIQHETKLSENLYTALGQDTKELSRKIAGEISRGISGGMMYAEIARNIAAWGRIPKNNAMRIARTEAHRIQCKATMDAQRKAKNRGADVVKQWDSSLDQRTRKSHVKIDGEIRELDEKFSNGLLYPGDPAGSAAEVINCRCALLQRARWNLGSDYTKWSPDAPVEIADDGTSQLVKIEASNYQDFKKQYNEAVEKIGKSSKIEAVELTDTDIKAVNDYISAKSYVVNEKLRTGENLSDSEQQFVENLNNALNKIPTYEGNLQRSLYFNNVEAVKEFMKHYKIGEPITYNEFLSTTKGEIYNPDGQIQIFIENAKNGKDISSINVAEQEVLYKNGSSFDVLNIVENEGIFFILLGEIE